MLFRSDGPPPITRTTFSTCRAYYPGGPRWVQMSVASPSARAFPEQQSGRRPRVPFRGLLRLHACYGPLNRSAAQWRPLSRGFNLGSCPPKPLVSYQTNRQFSGWNLPPLVLRAFGAHCCRKSRKFSSQKNLTKTRLWPLPSKDASLRHIRSSVVACLQTDVVPHSGTRRTRRWRGKISPTRQKILFRQHRSEPAFLFGAGRSPCARCGHRSARRPRWPGHAIPLSPELPFPCPTPQKREQLPFASVRPV